MTSTVITWVLNPTSASHKLCHTMKMMLRARPLIPCFPRTTCPLQPGEFEWHRKKYYPGKYFGCPWNTSAHLLLPAQNKTAQFSCKSYWSLADIGASHLVAASVTSDFHHLQWLWHWFRHLAHMHTSIHKHLHLDVLIYSSAPSHSFSKYIQNSHSCRKSCKRLQSCFTQALNRKHNCGNFLISRKGTHILGKIP